MATKVKIEEGGARVHRVLVLQLTGFKIKALKTRGKWDGSVWFKEDKACVVSLGNSCMGELLSDLTNAAVRHIRDEILKDAAAEFAKYFTEVGYPSDTGGRQ